MRKSISKEDKVKEDKVKEIKKMKTLICKKHKVAIIGIKCPKDERCRNFEVAEVKDES